MRAKTYISSDIRDMVESIIGPAPMKIGDIVTHPSGRKVKIISGQFWGTYGLSNHWVWKEVHEDGTLGKEEHGYGWSI